MTMQRSRRFISDSSGREVDVPYQIGVIFDDELYVVDLDRANLVEEARALTLYDLLSRGQRMPLREMLNKRKSAVSLNAELHRRARDWALESGVQVGRRGIVGKDVLRAYQEAMGLDPVVFEVPREGNGLDQAEE